MKTAVSIPDDVFQDAERLARHLQKTRSRLFADALRDYVERHDPKSVTDTINKVCDEVGNENQAFGLEAARRTLARSSW